HGGDRNPGARQGQRQEVAPRELPGKVDEVFRPQFRREGEPQDGSRGLPELPEPAGAARAQKRQEDHKLECRDEFLGYRKLTLLASLLEALLSRLLWLT